MTRRRGKSLIPPQHQTKVAVALSLVFAVSLVHQVMRARQKMAAGEAQAAVAAAAPFQSRLPEMLQAYAIDPLGAVHASIDDGVLPRDPFKRPPAPVQIVAAAPQAMFHEVTEQDEELTSASLSASEQAVGPVTDWPSKVAALSLKGICQSSDGDLALIDRHYMKAGQQIDGLTLTGIENGKVTLRDAEGGIHTLAMKGPKF